MMAAAILMGVDEVIELDDCTAPRAVETSRRQWLLSLQLTGLFSRWAWFSAALRVSGDDGHWKSADYIELRIGHGRHRRGVGARYTMRREPSGKSATIADARQARERVAVRGRVDLRAEVGWISRVGL